MEGLIVLFLLVLLLVVVTPIAALVKAARALRLVAALQAELRGLEARVAASARATAGGTARPEERAPRSPVAAPEPAPSPSLAPAPPPAARPGPPPEPVGVPVVAPRPLAPSHPAAAPVPPAVTPPLPPRPPVARPRAGSPPPSAPAFDWESLLGLKGAAWAGGVALVVAGILLAKLAIERGLITPELRVAALLLAGVGALVWAEVSLRTGYATTANAVSGAGIALLYVAFYAAYALYHLFPLGLTFALMALVTVVAGLVSIRYDAMFTAGLGLLGGFATPLLLSSGEDHPILLFGYLVLLNLGLFAVVRRARWPGFALAGLAGTIVIETLWLMRFMSPPKTLVGLAAFLVLGLLYVSWLTRAGERDDSLVLAGMLGGIVPFLFAALLAGDRAYAAEWPLLFGYVGLLDAALVAVALYRGVALLLWSAALATGIVLALWAAGNLHAPVVWGPTLAAIVLAILLNAPARLARRLALRVLRESRAALEVAGLTAGLGLGAYTFVLVSRNLGEPPWAFLALLAALTGLLLERTRPGRIPAVALGGALGLALLTQAWFFQHTVGTTLFRNLTVPLLFTIVLSLASAWRRAGKTAPGRSAAVEADDDEVGVVAATLVAGAGLFECRGTTLARDPWPLFAALAVALVLLVLSALRRDWTELVPLGLVGAAGFLTLWHQTYFRAADLSEVLPVYAAFYLAFLLLPFVVTRFITPSWLARPLPWVASALAGPVFFWVLYQAVVTGWGKAAIGALPVALAAVSVAALAGVSRRFPAEPADHAGRRRRLDYLALFAAVALGFVALAIPLQLDRQWITLGWALEAAAVWWLFGRLPHPGLKYFGAALYVGVGARLLANPEVLRYEERGLPILNWLLYTYGVPAACAFIGAALLARAEAARAAAPEADWFPGDRALLAPGASVLGLVLLFWLVNLEIVDYFSAGRYVEVALERQFARDLTMSVAWGVYALALLGIGLWRRVRALRFASLAVLLLTVAKVFLYDLATLQGLYRVVSFVGLGVSLILVSLLYQRFVFAREPSP